MVTNWQHSSSALTLSERSLTLQMSFLDRLSNEIKLVILKSNSSSKAGEWCQKRQSDRNACRETALMLSRLGVHDCSWIEARFGVLYNLDVSNLDTSTERLQLSNQNNFLSFPCGGADKHVMAAARIHLTWNPWQLVVIDLRASKR